MTERSILAYDNWKNAHEKFDYFMLGVIGAFCAYASQNIAFGQVGLNSSTLQLVSLLIMLSAGIAGFLRLQVTVELYRLGHHELHLSETKGNLIKAFNGNNLINEESGDVLTPGQVHAQVAEISKALPEIREQIEKKRGSTATLYVVRNALILFGFLLMLAGKVWATYEAA